MLNEKNQQCSSTLKFKRTVSLLFALFFLLPFSDGQNSQQEANLKGDQYLSKVTLTDNPDNDIKQLRQAMPWYKKAENWDKYVQCLNYLATAYYYSEVYDSTMSIALRTVNFAAQYIGKQSEGYKTSLINLGAIYDTYGNSDKALKLYHEALEIEQKYFNNKLDLYYTLANIGYAYHNLGDYEQAISFHKQSYEFAKDTLGNKSHEAGAILREIAKAYLAKNQLDMSLDFYSKSLEALKNLERKEFYEQTRWYVYVDMAEIYLQKKQKERALLYLNKALDIQSHYNLQEDHKSWSMLGNMYLQEGNFKLALENFNKAKAATEVEYPSYRNHPQKALVIANIASVYAAMDNFDAALKHYQTALQTIAVNFTDNRYSQNPAIVQFVNKSDALNILAGKASILFEAYRDKGGIANLEAANACYILMAELIHAIHQSYLAEGSKHTLSEKAVPIYDKAIEVALELHKATGKRAYLEQAFTFAEGNKAVLLFEAIRDQMAKGFAGVPDSLLDKERELQAEISFYEKKILDNKQRLESLAEGQVREWEGKILQLKTKRGQLSKLLENRYPSYFSLKYRTNPASFTTVSNQLSGENTALVEYMLGPRNGYVFFLTEKDLSVSLIKDRAATLYHLPHLREILATPPSSTTFSTDFAEFSLHASALYELLLKEGLNKLPGNTGHLVIVPDDALSYLPFEVLLTRPPTGKADFSPKILSYLFEDYAISYHYSATLWAHALQNRIELDEPPTFVGYAPSFAAQIASNERSCAGRQLSNLSCNQQEVLSICKLIRGSRAVLSNDASAEAFLLDAPSSGILHLATHACIDEASPGSGKIFFTDNYLSQPDLDQLHLNASLTVLSACNTGTGKLLTGEGVMSMARSFILAGSASVLTSLWAVDDCATADIMLHYYTFLKKGQSKSLALQKTRLAYLETADAERRHPYYWAAFVQIGDVSPLDFGHWWSGKPLQLLLMAGAMALAAFIFFYLRKKARKKHSTLRY